jgi:hypothetical protein
MGVLALLQTAGAHTHQDFFKPFFQRLERDLIRVAMLGGMSVSVSANTLGPIPPWITPELMEETRAVWQPYYEKELTDEDVLALLIPVGVLYEILFSKGVRNEESEEAKDHDEEVHRGRAGQ